MLRRDRGRPATDLPNSNIGRVAAWSRNEAPCPDDFVAQDAWRSDKPLPERGVKVLRALSPYQVQLIARSHDAAILNTFC